MSISTDGEISRRVQVYNEPGSLDLTVLTNVRVIMFTVMSFSGQKLPGRLRVIANDDEMLDDAIIMFDFFIKKVRNGRC